MKLRYLSKKEAKEMEESTKALGFEFVPQMALEVEGAEVLIGQGVFIRLADGRLFPSLLDRRVELLPKVEVDEGAKPHILNGANVMRPGIVEMDSSIKKGSLVLVKFSQEKLAVGASLYDRDEAIKMSKGVVIENLHWRGDRAWKAAVEALRKKP